MGDGGGDGLLLVLLGRAVSFLGQEGRGRHRPADGLLRYKDAGQAATREFSMAVVQANNLLEDQSQVESGPLFNGAANAKSIGVHAMVAASQPRRHHRAASRDAAWLRYAGQVPLDCWIGLNCLFITYGRFSLTCENQYLCTKAYNHRTIHQEFDAADNLWFRDKVAQWDAMKLYMEEENRRLQLEVARQRLEQVRKGKKLGQQLRKDKIQHGTSLAFSGCGDRRAGSKCSRI